MENLRDLRVAILIDPDCCVGGVKRGLVLLKLKLGVIVVLLGNCSP
jgi:hypothetical protein